MVEKPLGALLTGIVTARLLVACGGVSVRENGTDAGTGGVGGSGTGGSSVGGSGGSGTGGTGAAGGSGGVGGTGTGGAGVGGSGALGGTGAVGGSGASGGVGGTGALGGTGAFGGSGAVGGMGGVGPIGEQVWPLDCDQDLGSPRLTVGLALPEPVDHVAVYLAGSATPFEATGTACSGATDPERCLQAYTSATGLPLPPRPLATQQFPTTYAYVVWTRGDTVMSALDNDELRELLGDIDTPNEALMAFYVGGYAAACLALYEYDGGYFMTVPGTPVGCTGGYTSYRLNVTTAGVATVTGIGPQQFMCAGRRPRGLARSTPARADSAVGRFYARVAELEAAAVVAFDFIVDELVAVGAPDDLVRRAESAGRDEVRHARVMASLAERYGAEVPALRLSPRGVPTLLEMALENVTEGCVRETWGALSARYQSHAAESFADRLIWGEVADDEARHAELSWDLHGWFMSRLSPEEQREVEDTQRRAWDELVLELDEEPDRDVQRVAGVPSRGTALGLARDLAVRLKGWSRAPHAA